MDVKISMPAITDSKLSNYLIKNTTFLDIKTIDELFGKESSYTFDNVKFKNISSNSKAILYFLYNNIIINGIEVNNVSCTGDSGESSFILYDTDNSLNSKLQIDNLNVKNSVSNGAFIKVKGNSNEFVIKNSYINNINSYGPIIQYLSLNSVFEMTNVTLNNNLNKNKFDCGIIQLNNNIKASIKDSSFQNNSSKRHGGVFCIKNILNIAMDFLSNQFIGNKASNGGAISIMSEVNENNESYINFENNIFLKNSANNFGGAIYSEYGKMNSIKSINNTIANNTADIMGGGIFISTTNYKELLDINDWSFSNNMGNSHDDNYFTKPVRIKLNTSINNNEATLTTGEYLPLVFSMYDGYDQDILDITKYYSTLELKLSLKPININTEEEQKYELTGNHVSCLNGKFNFNNFRIFGTSSTYTLNMTLVNYNSDIVYDFNEIKINILECNDKQIKLLNNNKIPYCEDPICDSSCQNNNNTECVKPKDVTYVNDISKNICQCKSGWKGINCSEYDYLDYRHINRIIQASVTGIVVVMIIYIFFICINRNKRIIKDIGYYKILLLTVGTTIYFISTTFNTYENYSECSTYFVLKHIGILLILCINFINTILAYKLGSVRENKILFRFSNEDEFCEDETNNKMISKTDVDTNFSNLTKNLKISKSITFSLKKYKSEGTSLYDQMNLDFNRNIRATRAFFIEIVFSFILLILLILFLTIINSTKKDRSVPVYGSTGKWVYTCNLEKPNLILDSIEFILFILIFILGKTIKKYEFIFSYMQYITYLSYITISFGPTINILTYSIFNYQRLAKIYIDFLLNTICYISIFIFNSWKILYSIQQGIADDPTSYFIFKRHELCPKHNSNTCGCKINMSKENIRNNNENYISIYKICSSPRFNDNSN